MDQTEIEHIEPSDVTEWRDWLSKNHDSQQAVWLIFRKKSSRNPNLSWSEAVDEALCFGWIDSVKHTVDENRYKQYFGRRKPSSIWSKINKDKVAALNASGKMTQRGLEAVEIAKQNGMWTMMDSVENLEVPNDLEEAFVLHPGSKDFYERQSKSIRKQMLAWVAMAKRPDTRQKRIDEIVFSAKEGKKPKHMR